MIIKTAYVTLSTANSRYRHLGTIDSGRKTACGRLLTGDMVSEKFVPGDQGCLMCQRSNMMKRAEVAYARAAAVVQS